MGPLEIVSRAQRELLAYFSVVVPDAHAPPSHERVECLLDALRLQLRLAEEHLQPLVARVEGAERARWQSERLLTMRELMAELELFQAGSLEWRARLLALEDTLSAYVRSLGQQRLARLAAALDAREAEALLRALADAREGLWLRMRRDRLSDRPSLSETLTEG